MVVEHGDGPGDRMVELLVERKDCPIRMLIGVVLTAWVSGTTTERSGRQRRREKNQDAVHTLTNTTQRISESFTGKSVCETIVVNS
jgi:hypothetical protein